MNPTRDVGVQGEEIVLASCQERPSNFVIVVYALANKEPGGKHTGNEGSIFCTVKSYLIPDLFLL